MIRCCLWIVLLLSAIGLIVTAEAQQLPEPDFAHAEFDTTKIQSLIEKLGADHFDQREQAELELQRRLDESGYPIWNFLTNVDTTGQPVETRIRLKRILKSLDVTEGDIFHLKDCEGNPLPNAYCEVYEMKPKHDDFDKNSAKLVGRTTSQDNGDLRLPDLTPAPVFAGAAPLPSRRPAIGILVHTPGYGTAATTVDLRHQDVFLPLVKDGSKAARRAAHGTVVDESGNPIEGVAITPHSIELSGQGGYNFRGEGLVYSDHKGRFRVYGLPHNVENTVVPIGAKLQILLSAKGFFPSSVVVKNNEPQQLVLKRGGKFHRFTFEDTEVPADRKGVVVYRKSPDSQTLKTVLPHAFITDGGQLLNGTYIGAFYNQHGYEGHYKPIVVNADSPKMLEFKLPDAITYKGKVLDGITGDPAPEVVVFGAYSSMSEKLVAITDQQLESLQSAPMEELATHPTAFLLAKVKGIRCFTKTDEKGEYSVTLAPSIQIYGFYTVGPKILPFEIRALPSEELGNKNRANEPREPDELGVVKLGPMYRFPAARVHFSPQLPKGARRKEISIWPEWKIDDSVQPPWFDNFLSAKKARHGLPGFYPSFYFIEAGGKETGQRQTMTVPAGIQLQLRFRPQTHSGYGPARVAEKFLLKPGEEHDLGKFELRKTVPVLVRVDDANGVPVEGIAIRHRYADGGAWHIGVPTNANGTATIGVATDMNGEFGAIDIDGPEGPLRADNLKVPFEIGARRLDTFTIQLTKEQSALLPKEANR